MSTSGLKSHFKSNFNGFYFFFFFFFQNFRNFDFNIFFQIDKSLNFLSKSKFEPDSMSIPLSND